MMLLFRDNQKNGRLTNFNLSLMENIPKMGRHYNKIMLIKKAEIILLVNCYIFIITVVGM